MSITPDLKADEFELTTLCPVGACLAQITYAFSNEAKEQGADFIKEIKSNIQKNAEISHRNGQHKLPEGK